MSTTGYPFDGYDGSDEAFEKLTDHPAFCGDLSPHAPHEVFGGFGCPGNDRPAGNWVAEARLATGGVCPDPVTHNLHTDGRWMYERCPRCGGDENINPEPAIELVENADGVWEVPQS